jgi:sortase (surface protein transpeptidase)
VPAEGWFCAFVAPRSRPVAIALHPAAMADALRDGLSAANYQTGLAMSPTRIEVIDRHLQIPAEMREEASLGTMAMLVGKGGHVLIHGHRGNETVHFLPPAAPRQ